MKTFVELLYDEIKAKVFGDYDLPDTYVNCIFDNDEKNDKSYKGIKLARLAVLEPGRIAVLKTDNIIEFVNITLGVLDRPRPKRSMQIITYDGTKHDIINEDTNIETQKLIEQIIESLKETRPDYPIVIHTIIENSTEIHHFNILDMRDKLKDEEKLDKLKEKISDLDEKIKEKTTIAARNVKQKIDPSSFPISAQRIYDLMSDTGVANFCKINTKGLFCIASNISNALYTKAPASCRINVRLSTLGRSKFSPDTNEYKHCYYAGGLKYDCCIKSDMLIDKQKLKELSKDNNFLESIPVLYYYDEKEEMLIISIITLEDFE